MAGKHSDVLRIRITLLGLEPPIWRLIDVPGDYSFWDLHVAIQDSMGWLDYHLHRFEPRTSGTAGVTIGIPHEEYEDGALPGWEVPVSRHLLNPGDVLEYVYDFGDHWLHEVELVEVRARERGRKYPRCVDGAGACPPEDCGGVPGYEELLEILAEPSHARHHDMVEWLKYHARRYYPHDPTSFDRRAVRFSDPGKRFRVAFGGDA